MWYWHKNNHIDQRNRIESIEKTFIFNSFSPEMTRKFNEENSLFNRWYWSNWIHTQKKMNLDTNLTSCITISSKQIKDLNLRAETLKLTENYNCKCLWHWMRPLFLSFSKKGFVYLFLERGKGGRKRGRETSMRKRSIDPLPVTGPQPGTSLPPRRVPWLGIKPVTFCFEGWCPTNESHRSGQAIVS